MAVVVVVVVTQPNTLAGPHPHRVTCPLARPHLYCHHCVLRFLQFLKRCVFFIRFFTFFLCIFWNSSLSLFLCFVCLFVLLFLIKVTSSFLFPYIHISTFQYMYFVCFYFHIPFYMCVYLYNFKGNVFTCSPYPMFLMKATCPPVLTCVTPVLVCRLAKVRPCIETFVVVYHVLEPVNRPYWLSVSWLKREVLGVGYR